MFKSAKYITSSPTLKTSPNKDGFPEVVFMGRSNVGKSSIINALCNMKNLAYTSSSPGKTINMNYYMVEGNAFLVDVPGYGYAKKSQKTRIDFGSSMEEYLTKNPNFKMCYLLVDTKVGLTEDDRLMYNYLCELGVDFRLVLTKADKVPKTHLIRYVKNVSNEAGDVFVTSSDTKLGINELEQEIRNRFSK